MFGSMACTVICSDGEIDCSLRTLQIRSPILGEIWHGAPTDCDWCKPTLMIPDCESRTVSQALMCLETIITPGLLVIEEEARSIMDCMEILKIPWSYSDTDSNQIPLDPDNGFFQVT